ncbi:MAG TPA: hypothetical protein VHB48_10610, partial [Chitinophagaceae bacterium]|nr:hypothetical protein [Chitinophagaceae bacterium]
MNPVVRKILKVFAWITGSIIGLLILLLILIQIPAIQNFAKNRAVAYLQKKLKTKVSINKLSIAFPKEVVLKGVYFEDQHKDTLLYGKEIRVDIALLKLLSKKVEINYAELDGVKTHIYRVKPDTAFNFGYIVKAFAGTDTSKSPADTSGSGMSFTVNRVVLKDILATFKDDNSGNDVYFYLGSFDTKIKKLDPGKSKYSISGISMSGIEARVRQYKPYVSQKTGTALKKAAPAATTQPPAPDISLDELTIQNTKFSYNDEVAATQANIQIGNFTTHPENINTQNLFINLKDAALKNSRAAVTINKPAVPPPPKENDTTQSVNWHIATSKLLLDNEEIVFNNNTQPVQKRGIDYNHLHITALNLDAGAMNFTPSSYSGNIKNASFNERCGFALQKLSTDFYYTDTTAILRNLLVQAGRTLLKDKLAVKYKSLNDISQHIGNMYIDANLSNSTVDPKDILTFAPQLSENLKGIHNALLHINTTVTGYVKSLSIPVLTVSGIGATFVDLSGHIRGLPDAANALYDIKINTLKTTSADINALVLPSAMPASLRIPAQLSARGYFRGSTKDADSRLQLTSSSGNAFVKGGLHHEAYNAEVILNNLNVGYLTKQDSTIGAVTLTATAKGHDFDLKKAVADVQAKVQSFQLKGYTYKNLTLHGKATGGRVNVTGNMLDSNLRFNLTAGAGITTKYPSDVSLILRIDTANLQALHLADTIGLHGTINASLPSVNPDSLTGKISLAGFTITTPNKVLVPDSMLITADANGQHRSLDIKSDFLTARLAGVYTFTGISQALRQTINQYYNIPGYRDTTVEAEDWQLDARLTPTPFLLQAVSGMKGTDSITLHTTFNSLQRNLSASLKAKKIAFNNVRTNSLNISAATVPGKLSFSASAQGIQAGSAVINHTIVSGYVSNNKVNIALDVHDAGDKPQYNIAGLLQHITGGIKFSLNQSGLMLNYDNWAVAPDNFIAYDSSGLLVNNFNISNTNQSLSVNSQTKSPDAPLQVKFSNFRISTLTKMANTDNLMLGGIINGDAVVKNITTNPVFTSNLVIDSVVYQKDTIGTIAIKVNNEQANAFAANVTVKGKNNDIALAGTYFSGESRMDMKLDINRLDLAAVKPFAAGQLDDAGGELKGHVSIGGTTSKPSVTGSINFINAYIVPAISGERFTLDRQDVSVDSRGIHFNNFTLLDSAK